MMKNKLTFVRTLSLGLALLLLVATDPKRFAGEPLRSTRGV